MMVILAELFDRCTTCTEDKTECAEKLGITIEQMEDLIELHIKASYAANEFTQKAEELIDFDALRNKAREEFGDSDSPPFNPNLN